MDGILVDEPTYRATSAVIEYRDAEPVHAKGKSEPVPVWEVVAPRTRLGVDIAFKGGAELVGRTGRAPAPPRRRRARGARAVAAARDARRRAGDREEPPALRAVVGARQGLDRDSLLAPGTLAPLRRGRQLLGARRDGEGAGGHPRVGRVRRRRGEAAHRRRRAVVDDEVEALVGPGAPAAAGRSRRTAPGRGRPPPRGLRSLAPVLRVAGRAAPARARLRGPALGRRRPARLRRPPRRLGLRRPDPGRLHVPAGAPRAPAGLGRRQAQRPDRLALAALGRGDRAADRPPSSRGRPSRTAARRGSSPTRAATRSTPRNTSACSPSRSRGPRSRCPRRCRASSPRASTRSRPRRRRSSRARRSSARSSGSGRSTAVSGRPRDEVEEGLLRLERKEFVRRERRSSVAGETAFVFRHVLVRDVAYAQIPRGRPRRDAPAGRRVARGPGRRPRRGPGRPDRPPLPERAPVRAGRRARPRRPAPSGRATRSSRPATAPSGSPPTRPRSASTGRRWPPGRRTTPSGPACSSATGRRSSAPRASGADVLAEAAAELLDAGDLEQAAEAEVLLADLLMIDQGRREEAAAHVDHAASLLVERPPSRSKARVLASRANFHLAVDEAEEAMSVGRRGAARWPRPSGSTGLRAHALSTRGFARVMTGDLEGLRDLREGVEVADGANSPQAARGYNHLASITADLGDLPKAFELYEQSRRVAERFGDAIALGWLDVERAYELYWRGEWDAALELCDRLLDHGRRRRRLAARARRPAAQGEDRARTRGPGASARGRRERARASPGLSARRRCFSPRSHSRRTRSPSPAAGTRPGAAADELLRLWLDEGRGLSLASFWLADLAFALAALGRADGARLASPAARPDADALARRRGGGRGRRLADRGRHLRPHRLAPRRGAGAHEGRRGPRRRRPAGRGGRPARAGRPSSTARVAAPTPALAPAK